MSQIISLTLKKIKASSIPRDIPNISEQNAEFIKWLIREKNPNRMLEIGTANGYSTLHFASILSESATITTIDYAWNMHVEAVGYFKNCKLKNIHAIWGNAKAVIPTLADGYFDFIYVDAIKKEYLEYFILLLPKMTRNAIVVIDDVIKFKEKMQDFYDYLEKNNIKYRIDLTDPDDGIMIIEWKYLFIWD